MHPPELIPPIAIRRPVPAAPDNHNKAADPEAGPAARSKVGDGAGGWVLAQNSNWNCKRKTYSPSVRSPRMPAPVVGKPRNPGLEATIPVRFGAVLLNE